MAQQNSLNVKLPNSQLNKSKSAIKNGIEVILRLSSDLIVNPDDETNFPHKLLLRDRHVSNIHKAFTNNSSADLNFQKLNCQK